MIHEIYTFRESHNCSCFTCGTLLLIWYGNDVKNNEPLSCSLLLALARMLTHANTQTRTCACRHTHLHMQTYTYIHTHTHTHTHTHNRACAHALSSHAYTHTRTHLASEALAPPFVVNAVPSLCWYWESICCCRVRDMIPAGAVIPSILGSVQPETQSV